MMDISKKELNEALFQACIAGNINIAEFLLKSGADANYKDEEGYTPLSVTLYKDVEELLKKHGAK
jgi:ankyrin repeat protein